MDKRFSKDLLGTASTASTLTAAYAGNRAAIPIEGYNQAVLYVKYTPAAGQSDRDVSLSVEFSPDGGTTYFPLSKGSDNAVSSFDIITDVNTQTFRIPGATGSVAETAYYRRIPIALGEASGEIADPYLMRVSAKEDGSANFGTIYVRVALTNLD